MMVQHTDPKTFLLYSEAAQSFTRVVEKSTIAVSADIPIFR